MANGVTSIQQNAIPGSRAKRMVKVQNNFRRGPAPVGKCPAVAGHLVAHVVAPADGDFKSGKVMLDHFVSPAAKSFYVLSNVF